MLAPSVRRPETTGNDQETTRRRRNANHLAAPTAKIWLRRNGLRLRQDASPAPIASGRAGGCLVMTRCTRALQRTNARHLGTPPNRWWCGRSRPFDDAAPSDMAKDRRPLLRSSSRAQTIRGRSAFGRADRPCLADAAGHSLDALADRHEHQRGSGGPDGLDHLDSSRAYLRAWSEHGLVERLAAAVLEDDGHVARDSRGRRATL
jgi:hypothetical protein